MGCNRVMMGKENSHWHFEYLLLYTVSLEFSAASFTENMRNKPSAGMVFLTKEYIKNDTFYYMKQFSPSDLYITWNHDEFFDRQSKSFYK